MKKLRVGFAIGVFLVAVSLGSSLEAKIRLHWNNYPDGIRLGKQEEKDILIHFYATWCKYCEKMEKETYGNRKVAEYLDENFVLVKVDVEKNRHLSASYFVRGLPMIWFLKESGERITALPGYVPPNQFLPIVKFIHTQAYEKMSFKEFMEKEEAR